MDGTRDLGLGAMIRLLSGNGSTVRAVKCAIGRTISAIAIVPDLKEDGALKIDFADGSTLLLFDEARSCCEHRYMNTDDDLAAFVGAALIGGTIREGGSITDKYENVCESQFLHIETSAGAFDIANYNEHNGYYEGIVIAAEFIDGNGETNEIT